MRPSFSALNTSMMNNSASQQTKMIEGEATHLEHINDTLSEALASQADLIHRQREELKDKSRIIRLLTESNIYQTSRVEALHTALFERDDRIQRLHSKLAAVNALRPLPVKTFPPFKFTSVFDALHHPFNVPKRPDVGGSK